MTATMASPPPATAEPKRLRRDKKNGVLGGVCSGIAEYYGLDPVLVRVGYVLLSILTAAFPGILVYIILWVIIPAKE